MLVEMYQRWLFEVWGKGDESVARELLHADLIDHNALPQQPKGREGDQWAARAIRKAFPDVGRPVPKEFMARTAGAADVGPAPDGP